MGDDVICSYLIDLNTWAQCDSFYRLLLYHSRWAFLITSMSKLNTQRNYTIRSRYLLGVNNGRQMGLLSWASLYGLFPHQLLYPKSTIPKFLLHIKICNYGQDKSSLSSGPTKRLYKFETFSNHPYGWTYLSVKKQNSIFGGCIHPKKFNCINPERFKADLSCNPYELFFFWWQLEVLNFK